MSRPVFEVHRDHQVVLSSQWLENVPGCDADWIEAEDLTTVSIESIYVIERDVYFFCKRLVNYAGKLIHWDLFDALDLKEYPQGDLAESILTLIFSQRDSVTMRLENPIVLPTINESTMVIDGLNWCQSAQNMLVRPLGTSRWVSVNLIANDPEAVRELIVEVAYSLQAATCEASA